MRVRKAVLATAVATLSLAVPAGAAAADPKVEGTPVVISCDNGHTYQAAVAGNGEFTPAHDLDSNTMLIPTAFHGFSGTVTDSEGNVIDQFDDPTSTFKGASDKERSTSTSCQFTFSEVFEDPDLGTLTFTATGGVSGFLTPAR